MLTTRAEIIKWLRLMEIENYTINDDLVVDVAGDVSIDNKQLKEIPVQFGNVAGHFYCYDNQLTSLEHCPSSVGGEFLCDNNKLTSLEHCPKLVGEDFYCSDNNLSSLKHCPSSVGGEFLCYNNELTDLSGCTLEQLLMLKEKYMDNNENFDNGFEKLLIRAFSKVKAVKLNNAKVGRDVLGVESDIDLT